MLLTKEKVERKIGTANKAGAVARRQGLVSGQNRRTAGLQSLRRHFAKE